MNFKCAYNQEVEIDKLIPHPRNPNKHNNKQISLLAKIIEKQGWRNPITVSKKSGYVVAGHARLKAAKSLGCKTVPVDYQDFEDDAMEYAHMVADNKIAELSKIDMSMINVDVMEFGPDFDLDLLGMIDFKVDIAEKPIKDKKPKKCPECGHEWN